MQFRAILRKKSLTYSSIQSKLISEGGQKATFILKENTATNEAAEAYTSFIISIFSQVFIDCINRIVTLQKFKI